MSVFKKDEKLSNSSFLGSFFVINKNGKKRPSVRFYRYLTIFGVHLFFVLSFWVDVQILEGDISASRLLGFHLADPFITLETILARGEFAVNLLIGTITILLFYTFIAGRAFCAWVCPYNFLAEFGEEIHLKLVKKGFIKEREFSPNLRFVFFACFVILSLLSGFLIFEIFNVVGILSRFIIYGFSGAILWVLLVFLGEIFFARRFWCRYVCPIGTFYALLPPLKMVKISWDKSKCDECGVCVKNCLVPHVLKSTKTRLKTSENLTQKFILKSTDCTNCGRCVDTCHTNALKFSIKGEK